MCVIPVPWPTCTAKSVGASNASAPLSYAYTITRHGGDAAFLSDARANFHAAHSGPKVTPPCSSRTRASHPKTVMWCTESWRVVTGSNLVMATRCLSARGMGEE